MVTDGTPMIIIIRLCVKDFLMVVSFSVKFVLQAKYEGFLYRKLI